MDVNIIKYADVDVSANYAVSWLKRIFAQERQWDRRSKRLGFEKILQVSILYHSFLALVSWYYLSYIK